MGIGYWDPTIGIAAREAMRAEMNAKAQAYREQLRHRRAPKASPKKSTKCPGCGSHTYAITSGGRICSYCRTPEGDAT